MKKDTSSSDRGKGDPAAILLILGATIGAGPFLDMEPLSRSSDRRYHPSMPVLSTVTVARSRRRFAYALAVLLAVVVPIATFYGWFELQSRLTTDREGLDAGYANALKHAEAAAALYSTLRFVGVHAQASERIVVGLGIVNEHAELYVKLGSKDSTLEMMRDLHSNMVGISAARWRESDSMSDHRSRSEQLVALVRACVLLRSEDDVSLPPEEKLRAKQSADLDWAISWFERSSVAIERQVVQALRDTRP
jgi:hypothetical protein